MFFLAAVIGFLAAVIGFLTAVIGFVVVRLYLETTRDPKSHGRWFAVPTVYTLLRRNPKSHGRYPKPKTVTTFGVGGPQNQQLSIFLGVRTQNQKKHPEKNPKNIHKKPFHCLSIRNIDR